jgi:hypothetical protein
MMYLMQSRTQRFLLGFVLACAVYFVTVWYVYDGPMLRMVPGMATAGVFIGLLFVWSPRKLGPPPA